MKMLQNRAVIQEALSSKSLVEHLEEAPRKIIDFMTAISKNYMSQMLAVVKSYWPQHNLAPVAKEIAADCSDQDFLGYCKETEPIAEEICHTRFQKEHQMYHICVLGSSFTHMEDIISEYIKGNVQQHK
jgi:predicted membrane channel-forming protein YqfA (hemolysin III family)